MRTDTNDTRATLIGVGVDLIEVDRIQAALIRRGGRFERAIFTPTEIASANRHHSKLAFLAECFASKEAVLKALGTGLVKMSWALQVELEILDSRHPSVHLSHEVADLAASLSVKSLTVDVSASDTLAVAFAIALGETPSEILRVNR